MPKSVVKKHCSILNYLEYEHPDLFDLLRQTCSLGFFSFRKEYSGLTFLRPEGKMLTELKRMASGDSIEEFNDTLKSLILLDGITTLSEFGEKKANIPTLLRKKLPVKSVSATKVTLENGAEISVDEKFQARNDRDNICVYVIDGGFVPTDTPAATLNPKRPSAKVRGGAEFKANKKELFNDVLASWVRNPNRDAALETLVTICTVMKNRNADKYKAICSQLSYDTLASLAIVLQPCSTRSTYLNEEDVRHISSMANAPGLVDVYAYCGNPVNDYEQHRLNGHTDKAKEISELSVHILTHSNKLNIVSEITKAYSSFSSMNSDSLSSVRRNVFVDSKLAYAESELRVLSALVQANHMTRREMSSDLKKLFNNDCTLDSPYILASKSNIASCNLGFYYSSVHLLARSNALIFFPNLDNEYTSNLDNIYQDSALLNLDSRNKTVLSSLPVYKATTVWTPEQRAMLQGVLANLGINA